MAIEKCLYCNKEHETGEGMTLGGMGFTVCPEVPQNVFVPMPQFISYVSPIGELLGDIDRRIEDLSAHQRFGKLID